MPLYNIKIGIMNYSEKLKVTRFRQSTIKGRCFNEEMESDRGRAVNSAAVMSISNLYDVTFLILSHTN